MNRSLKFFTLSLTLSTQFAFAGPMTEKKIGSLSSLRGSYTSLVVRYSSTGAKTFQYFTEQTKSGTVADRCIDNDPKYYCPGISMQTGSSATSISGPKLVVDPYGLERQRKLTRNAVVYSEKDKRYYALGYVNYGSPQTGYFFRSLSSNPSSGWESLGPISAKKGGYSGTNLIVNDSYAGGALDHRNPMNSKFIHYTQLGANFQLMYSNDGREWFIYKNAQGSINLLPSKYAADEKWGFASVVKTNSGYFMSVTVGWDPIKVHRLLYSRNGLDWRTQIGTESGGSSNAKNYSLSYDAKSDTVYVMQTKSPSDHYKILYSFKASSKAPSTTTATKPTASVTTQQTSTSASSPTTSSRSISLTGGTFSKFSGSEQNLE